LADAAINVHAVCLHSCQALHSVRAERVQEGCVRYSDTGVFLESYLQILVEFISLAVLQQLIQYKLFSAWMFFFSSLRLCLPVSKKKITISLFLSTEGRLRDSTAHCFYYSRQ